MLNNSTSSLPSEILKKPTTAYHSLVILKITKWTRTSDAETINVSYLTHFSFDNRPLLFPFILELKFGKRGLIDLNFFWFRYKEGRFSEMPLLFWFVIDIVLLVCLLLVLPFAPRDFRPSTPAFPFPPKPTFPNSNLTRNQVDEEPLWGYATSKSLFIHLFFDFQFWT